MFGRHSRYDRRVARQIMLPYDPQGDAAQRRRIHQPKFRNSGPRNARNTQNMKLLMDFLISLDG